MTAAQLAQSAIEEEALPEGLSLEAQALWLARAGKWEQSHDLCQDVPDPAGAWIHAWLHREEGDYGNACYWYQRAGKPAVPEKASLEEEWMEIAKELVG